MTRTANIISLTTGTEVPQEDTHLPDMWQLCEDPQGCNLGLCDWNLPLPAVCVRGCSHVCAGRLLRKNNDRPVISSVLRAGAAQSCHVTNRKPVPSVKALGMAQM